MKFTKEEALESLKRILTLDGKKTLRMSEQSIKSQLETLVPLIANDEMELKDFLEKVKGSFEVMNSNAEKDRSDFVKEWKGNHPENKDNKDDDDKNHKDDDDMPKGFKALFEKMESMEKRWADMDKRDLLSKKRSELNAAMEKKGIKDEDWRKSVLEEFQIDEDTDVDAKADTFLKLYNKAKALEGDEDFTPLSSSKSGNKNKLSNMFDDIKDEFKRVSGDEES